MASFTGASPALLTSQRAVAATNRNIHACDFCHDKRRKCDRGPDSEIAWVCSSCKNGKRACKRKGVAGAPLAFDRHNEFMYENIEQIRAYRFNPRKASSVPASDCLEKPSEPPALVAVKHEDTARCQYDQYYVDSSELPTETLFQGEGMAESPKISDEDTSTWTVLGTGDLNFEISEFDLLERWTGSRYAQWEVNAFSEEQLAPTFGFIHVLGTMGGREGRTVLKYQEKDCVLVALCDSRFVVQEGPYWYDPKF